MNDDEALQSRSGSEEQWSFAGTTLEGLRRAAGTSRREIQAELAISLAASIPKSAWRAGDGGELSTQAGLAMLEEIGPSGVEEGMLALQMVTLHNAAMECFERAIARSQSPQVTDMYLRNGARLSSLFEKHLTSLAKRRGKGQQIIRVEHVDAAPARPQRVRTVTRDSRKATDPLKNAAPRSKARRQVSNSDMLLADACETAMVEELQSLQAVTRG